MRKVILFIASSLDGYIAGKDEDLTWLFTDSDYGYNNFYSGIDTILTGRKTFDLAVKLGDTFKGKTVYVFTRKQSDNHDNLTFINSGIPAFVKDLKKRDGMDIWLLGGSEIITFLQNSDLIDEYIISVHPVVLGEGIPLFMGIKQAKKLKLMSIDKFDSGLVQLKFIKQNNLV